ncbi:Ankyrin repeat domain containing protein [Asbolus verrucosus]|uniref:Ankyrin repeat domain containing protein n=1 Tax=Asbolus verrucosus TaxID=1661398 RepID=A0A482W409_ASBVE|nr:Ankyrin repeat domain containing protein [Asbolus verrucosus]
MDLIREHLKNPNANVNAKNKNYETPLLAAIRIPNKEISLQIVRTLIDTNANINSQDYQGDSPLHEITRIYLKNETHDRIFNLIIEFPNCDVNSRNLLGEVPLHLVTSVCVAEKLIQHGAIVNKQDNSGNTPLHRLTSHAEICEILIKNAANVNCKNVNGLTPLHEAVFRNSEEIVKLLLKCEADPNLESDNWVTPLLIAYRFRVNENIKELLWSRTKSTYLTLVANYDQSLIPKILQIWKECKWSEQETVSFLESQIKFLSNCSYSIKVTCGQVIARYFLDIIVTISHKNSFHIIETFYKCFGRSLINFLIKTHDYTNQSMSELEVFDIISTLFHYGDLVDYSDIEVVYLQLGDCFLLHMLLKIKLYSRLRQLQDLPFFLKALCTVNKNLTHIINDYKISNIEILDFFDVHNLARYCTLPKRLLQHFADTFRNIMRFQKPIIKRHDIEHDIKEMEKIAGIATLLELSRNALRPVLCEKYKIATTDKLYSLLIKLRLPPIIVSLIMMESPIHSNINVPTYFPYNRCLYLL